MDIAVVGAGLAGLVCAKQLQRAGYEVTVVEKSRGLGGRLATRRLAGTWADHGVRYLESQGLLTGTVWDVLSDRAVIHPWQTPVLDVAADGTVRPRSATQYVSEPGITAVAKALAEGLNILRGQRVTAIAPNSKGWTLTCEATASEPVKSSQLSASGLVMMIPAPQALDLVKPLATYPTLTPVIQALQTVTFDPCLTAIAAYAPEAIALESASAFHFSDHSTLAWASIEASKSHSRSSTEAIAVVVQSKAQFAEQHLDEPDLMPVGRSLLASAAPYLGIEGVEPHILQVHRWHYAFCQTPYSEPYVQSSESGLLLCGGDWCGGRRLEDALASGLRTALAVIRQMDNDCDRAATLDDLRRCLQSLI